MTRAGLAPDLTELAGWLRHRLGAEDLPSVYRPGPEPVSRLALALEPGDLPQDLSADALFLHRPFRLGARFPGLGVLASHDGFDAQLTTGQNWPLARRLGWSGARALGWQGRPLGLLADLPGPSWTGLLGSLNAELGGWDFVAAPRIQPSRVLLANALRPELVHLAAAEGAGVYLTGQFRPGARAALAETGLGVVALGHRRSEKWGLRQLERELRAAFPDLSTDVY